MPGISTSEFFLYPDQLVVLCDAVGARQRTSLDLPDADRNREVGDGYVLGFPRTVRDDARIARRFGGVYRVKGLTQRSDLIDLDQH